MNRSVSALLFFAAALLVGGCSDGSHSMRSAGSPGDPGVPPAAPMGDTDLGAFARAGMTDAEYVEARDVNGMTFVSAEDPDAFADWF